jgi:hypothetical protein
MTTRSRLADLLADPVSAAPAIISTCPLVVVSHKALGHFQNDRLRASWRMLVPSFFIDVKGD